MIKQPTEARVNITWLGQNGDLPDLVRFDATDAEVRQWVTEAARAGSIPGIHLQADLHLNEHIVERFDANGARPYNLIQVRPKTAFG